MAKWIERERREAENFSDGVIRTRIEKPGVILRRQFSTIKKWCSVCTWVLVRFAFWYFFSRRVAFVFARHRRLVLYLAASVVACRFGSAELRLN